MDSIEKFDYLLTNQILIGYLVIKNPDICFKIMQIIIVNIMS